MSLEVQRFRILWRLLDRLVLAKKGIDDEFVNLKSKLEKKYSVSLKDEKKISDDEKNSLKNETKTEELPKPSNVSGEKVAEKDVKK